MILFLNLRLLHNFELTTLVANQTDGLKQSDLSFETDFVGTGYG